MSSNDIAVSVRGLSKSYTIAHNKEKHVTLAESLLHRLKDPFEQVEKETFWALKDVEFDIKKGDVVGIIGRNGAGKSTLLKILSRITEPTAGRIDLFGRVSSLLEVGTGFHAELTGRENIHLNGAILGMTRREIARQFDDIVDFSGVEQFLDTPVKRYSSGMYVRLAFAVAAHLSSEILVVDEVLAVGDADFQKKCLGKMQDVAHSGRTVLLVSHNLPMITRVCNQCVLLVQGRCAEFGSVHSVSRTYAAASSGGSAAVEWESNTRAPGDEVAQLLAVRIRNGDGNVSDRVLIEQPTTIEVEYKARKDGNRVTSIIHLMDSNGVCAFASNDYNNLEWWNAERRAGIITASCTIPGHFLAEGQFSVLAALGSYNPNVIHALVQDAVCFTVVDHTEGEGVRGIHTGDWPGIVRPMLEWQISRRSN